MGNYNFPSDLADGKKTELEIAEILKNHPQYKGLEIVEFSDKNDFDFSASFKGVITKFEIKEDKLCEKTGNVGVEYECRGKPSGIAVTQADFYIYRLHVKNILKSEIAYQFPATYVIDVMHSIKDLKDMIDNKAYFRKVVGGDFGSKTKLYLFKMDIFIRTGMVLNSSHPSYLNLLSTHDEYLYVTP